MCDELEILEFIESDDDESDYYDEDNSEVHKRRKLRHTSDPFTMDDQEFIKKYRLSKELVHNLCEDLRPHMRVPKKSTDISVETKVLVALTFYATGSYQRPNGVIAGHSIAQPTVSKILKDITALLNLPQIKEKYIKWPQTAEERRTNILSFYNKFGMPGVLGCIDCTHVAIVRPSQHKERYYCPKKYNSLNVQLICNAEMYIMSVDASHGGAIHDSTIWLSHPLEPHMQELNRNESVWLLGDSAYPQRIGMMTPISNAWPGTLEARYTEIHKKTRNIIDRAIGLLKARFRCLLVQRVLHYKPEVAASIVNACVILHNMCISADLPVPELTESEAFQESTMQLSQPYQSQSSNDRDLSDGLAARRALVTYLSSYTRH